SKSVFAKIVWTPAIIWNRGVGTIYMDFYSPSCIWDFLKTKTCETTNALIEFYFNYTIYPNPSTEIINFPELKQFLKIEVFDLCGKLVFNNVSFEGENKALPLKNGIYNIKITSNYNEIIWKKVSII
ncbi:MAG: T9SS type A sorting domain-containing protein, partial [Crocinitomicaceae bacterium]